MFDDLEDEIKRDEQANRTPKQRWLLYATVLPSSAVVFGGLYAAIKFLE